jgi:hypothetical protein
MADGYINIDKQIQLYSSDKIPYLNKYDSKNCSIFDAYPCFKFLFSAISAQIDFPTSILFSNNFLPITGS